MLDPQHLQKRMLVASLVIIGLICSLSVVAFAQDEEDWDEIIRLAQEEGRVVVYATSSRMDRAGQAFTERYGIVVESTKMDDVEISTRVIREVDAGLRNVDLIMAEDAAVVVTELLPDGYVSNYVPSSHQDVIAAQYQEPLVFLLQVRMIGYNDEAYDNPPIQSLWDLTQDEWRNRFFLRNPEITSTNLAFFSELIRRSDDLEDDYEQRYGEPLELTTENAGWELIKGLARNAVAFSSDTDVGDAVGARGQSDPPIGLYVLGKHRDIPIRDLALEIPLELTPVVGYMYPAYLLQVRNAPNPNAAKLFTQFLLEDEGAQAWTQDLGAFSTNPNASFHPDDPVGGLAGWEAITWNFDPMYAAQMQGDIIDFWMRHSR